MLDHNKLNEARFNVSQFICGCLSAFLAIGSSSHALAAPKSVDAEIQKIENYCYSEKSSMSEGRDCVAKSVIRIRKDIDKSVRKRLFDIDEVERKTSDEGYPNGKTDADRWRASFAKEQKAWAEYEKVRCENVVQFENAGGSGAGGFAMKCSIRLMLERLRELDDGY